MTIYSTEQNNYLYYVNGYAIDEFNFKMSLQTVYNNKLDKHEKECDCTIDPTVRSELIQKLFNSLKESGTVCAIEDIDFRIIKEN